MLRIIFLRGAQTVTVVLIHRRKLTKPAFPPVNTETLANKSITQVSSAPDADSEKKKKKGRNMAALYLQSTIKSCRSNKSAA